MTQPKLKLKTLKIDFFGGNHTIDLEETPFITGPNASGKSLILELINDSISLACGREPGFLDRISASPDKPPFSRFELEFDNGMVTAISTRPSLNDYTWELRIPGKEPYVHDFHIDNTRGISDVPLEKLVCGTDIACVLNKSGMDIDERLERLVDIQPLNIDEDFVNGWMNRMFKGESTPTRNYVNRIHWCAFSKHAIKQWRNRHYMSTGELEFFAQLLAVVSGAPLVLFDTPEFGLHMSAQVEYDCFLEEASERGLQVICATHSPQLFSMSFSRTADLYELSQSSAESDEHDGKE